MKYLPFTFTMFKNSTRSIKRPGRNGKMTLGAKPGLSCTACPNIKELQKVTQTLCN